jgi:hypothetical protein
MKPHIFKNALGYWDATLPLEIAYSPAFNIEGWHAVQRFVYRLNKVALA